MNWKLLSSVLLFATLALHPFAHAQTYPNRVVKMVVPAGPAGPTDLLGRLIANELSNTLGQTVIIENHPGAGGAIGTRDVAKAQPDGYTLLVGNTATLATIPAMSKNAGYDPLKDFAGVAKIMVSFQLLLVRPDLPVKSVSELIAYAKANPGKLNYAAVGAGNITHLSAELLKKKTGIDFLVVQYKSGGEAMNALMAGQADFAISNVTVVRPLLTSGKLRALAVTSDKRQAGFDLPTMIEAGIPDYVVQSYFGIVAPAGTPQPILDKLNAQTRAALKTPKFEGVLQKFDAAPNDETAQQFQSFIAQEAKRWKDIADVTGIKLD